MQPVYKDDVEEIIYTLQGDIADIKEKKDKYIEKADTEIVLKTRYVGVLKEIAKDLPEKQPKLFPPRTDITELTPLEKTAQEILDGSESITGISAERNGEKIVDIHKQ